MLLQWPSCSLLHCKIPFNWVKSHELLLFWHLHYYISYFNFDSYLVIMWIFVVWYDSIKHYQSSLITYTKQVWQAIKCYESVHLKLMIFVRHSPCLATIRLQMYIISQLNCDNSMVSPFGPWKKAIRTAPNLLKELNNFEKYM